MDNGYQYFKKKSPKDLIMPHVKIWLMDEKWYYACNHKGVA